MLDLHRHSTTQRLYPRNLTHPTPRVGGAVRSGTKDAARRVTRMFSATISYLRTHPGTFDQKLINCLMKSFPDMMHPSYQYQVKCPMVYAMVLLWM